MTVTETWTADAGAASARLRQARALVRRETKSQGRAGALTVASVLTSPTFASMLVWHLVQFIPGIGSVHGANMMRACRIDSWARTGRLTDRQRRALVVQLERHAAGLPVLRGEALELAAGNVAPVPEPEPVPPVPVDPLLCVGCGARLRVRSRSGLCGFCIEEREAA